MLQEDHCGDFLVLAMPPRYPFSFQEVSLARASFPVCQNCLRICCLAELWGEGKGTAALCWGITTWMKHAWKIPNHRPVVSCSKIKGIFYKSNTFQCCTCESGDGQHAQVLTLFVWVHHAFCIHRIKCLLFLLNNRSWDHPTWLWAT